MRANSLAGGHQSSKGLTAPARGRLAKQLQLPLPGQPPPHPPLLTFPVGKECSGYSCTRQQHTALNPKDTSPKDTSPEPYTLALEKQALNPKDKASSINIVSKCYSQLSVLPNNDSVSFSPNTLHKAGTPLEKTQHTSCIGLQMNSV